MKKHAKQGHLHWTILRLANRLELEGRDEYQLCEQWSTYRSDQGSKLQSFQCPLCELFAS
jgi:SAM-dependent MidA family methyltransferase